MGRINGFIGGAVLTSSIMYLSLVQLQTDARTKSHILRESRKRLDALLLPAPTLRNPKPHIARPSLVETIKDQWNWEIESMVRRLQAFDLVKAREGVEETVGNIVEKIKKEVK